MSGKKKPKRKNIKIIGRRNYDEEVAEAMLYYVIGQKVFPICRSEPASHGAGIAVAQLAVHVMQDKVSYIRDCVYSRIADLKGEEDFCYNKLTEHIKILTVGQKILAATLDRKNTQLTGSRQANGTTINMLNGVFRLLDTDNVFFKGLIEIEAIMNQHLQPQLDAHMQLTEYILTLAPAIRETVKAGEDPDHDFSTKIEPLLRGELKTLKRRVDTLLKRTEEMKKKLEKDWQLDMGQISSRKTECRRAEKWVFSA